MTTPFAQGWLNFILDNIKRWGRKATITRATSQVYDTTTLEAGKGTPTVFTDILVCTQDYNSKTFAALKEQPTNSTLTGMKLLYIMSSSAYTPTVGDVISLENDWRLLALMAQYEINSTQCAYMWHIGQ
jgi:hypothetical protein